MLKRMGPKKICDVSMEDLLDQIKKDSSQQEFKAKNELYKAPRAVRKAVEAPGLLFVFDPERVNFNRT